jgi:tRNA (guanine-N7-)-methyltransferase
MNSQASLKPPPDRLYGRSRGHALRPRQQKLLDIVLPRLRLPEACAGAPLSAFEGEASELWLEVGAGGGEHAEAQAAARRAAAVIACETYVNGLCSLLSRLVAEGEEETGALPANLRLWPGDARILIRRLPDASLTRLFLLFPDPWPKTRHAKRRFVHPAVLPELARVLVPGGEWRVASDDSTYQAWVGEVMAGQSLFETSAPATMRPEGWPPTRYEAKALRAGRTPLYWSFIRR